MPVFCKLPAKNTYFLLLSDTISADHINIPCSPIKRLSPRRQPIKTRILFLKRPDHFEQAVFREDLFVFRVLATVKFGTPLPTRMLKVSMHILTGHLRQQRKKRADENRAKIICRLQIDPLA